MNSLQSILAGNGNEFFTYEGQALVTSNRTQYNIDEAPKHVTAALDNFLIENPEKEKAYREMVGESGVRSQCIKCLFSNLDGTPDLTEDGLLNPEYVECPNRGSCKWEGIGCLAKKPCQFGLSQREQEIADLADLTNEQIAERLFLSKHTVSTHLQNVQRKVGVRNKKQLIKIRPSIWRQH